jgi:putative heme-binding domain-containing protein
MEEAGAQRPGIERGLAEVQGESGVLFSWRAIGPLPSSAAGSIEDIAEGLNAPAKPDGPPAWRTLIAEGIDSPLRFGSTEAPGTRGADNVWLARSEISVPEETTVQFLGASSGKLEVRLNGRPAYRRDEARAFRADSDRFEATLGEGTNRILLRVSSPEGPAEFHLRFRRKSSTAEREALIAAALNRAGEAGRGRKLFFDVEKLPCSKCHAIRGQGERFGPDLTGIGRRFSRMHLIESILEPGRAIAPSYETTVLVLKNGQVLSGIKVVETAEAVTLVDSQARQTPVAKSAIADRRLEPLSIMPEGLERQLTAEEFVDLMAFLVGEK